MKKLLRNVTFYTISLYIISLSLEGVKIFGGPMTFIMGGLILSVLFLVLKPILNIVSLPLNIVTLGLFSFFTNAIILYLTSIIIPGISISAFAFRGISFAGFVVPSFYFNNLLSYVVAAAMLSISFSYLTWISDK